MQSVSFLGIYCCVTILPSSRVLGPSSGRRNCGRLAEVGAPRACPTNAMTLKRDMFYCPAPPWPLRFLSASCCSNNLGGAVVEQLWRCTGRLASTTCTNVSWRTRSSRWVSCPTSSLCVHVVFCVLSLSVSIVAHMTCSSTFGGMPSSTSPSTP